MQLTARKCVAECISFSFYLRVCGQILFPCYHAAVPAIYVRTEVSCTVQHTLCVLPYGMENYYP